MVFDSPEVAEIVSNNTLFKPLYEDMCAFFWNKSCIQIVCIFDQPDGN